MNAANLPAPPSNISSRSVSIFELDSILYRTHDVGRAPIFFGRARIHRFDSPDASYGVLYTGRDAFCAFVETLASAAGTSVVTTAALKRRALSELKPARPLRLVDLTVSGALVRIGADARLFSGSHEIAQLWSRALHDHPSHPDGLLFPSRLDPARQGIAIFEDRAPKMKELSRRSWYETGGMRHLLAEIMEHYRFELIENQSVVTRKPASRQEGLF